MIVEEKINNLSLKLIDLLRNRIGAYNLYGNVVSLLFLKYITFYSDKLNFNNIDSYKLISSFKRKCDLAKTGNPPLKYSDIYEVLKVLDDEKICKDSLRFVDLIRHYDEILSYPEIQKDVLRVLDDFDIEFTIDYLNNFFESLIYRCTTDVSRTGLSVTNQSLRKLVAMLLDVKENEVYLDCCCGYSTTLLNIKKYKKYIGYEINPETALISEIELIMFGNRNFEINAKDFIDADTFEIANKIFADGPISFSGTKPFSCDKFGTETKDIDLIYLYKILDSLSYGGRAVIAVAAKVLFSDSKSYTNLRNKFTDAGLRAVISLPSLSMGTSLNTNLLLIEKGYVGNVEFVEAKNFTFVDRKLMILSDDNIVDVVDAIKENKSIEGFSKSVNPLDVIKESTWLPLRYIEQKQILKYRPSKIIDVELDKLYEELKKNL